MPMQPDAVAPAVGRRYRQQRYLVETRTKKHRLQRDLMQLFTCCHAGVSGRSLKWALKDQLMFALIVEHARIRIDVQCTA